VCRASKGNEDKDEDKVISRDETEQTVCA